MRWTSVSNSKASLQQRCGPGNESEISLIWSMEGMYIVRRKYSSGSLAGWLHRRICLHKKSLLIKRKKYPARGRTFPSKGAHSRWARGAHSRWARGAHSRWARGAHSRWARGAHSRWARVNGHRGAAEQTEQVTPLGSRPICTPYVYVGWKNAALENNQ